MTRGMGNFMQRWSLSIILVAVAILSAACTYDKPVEETMNSPFVTDSFTIDGDEERQEFHIIRLQTALKNYITKAKENQAANLPSLYDETVFQPAWNVCFDKGEYIGIIQSIRENPPTNFNRLEKAIELLDNPDATKTIKDALIKSQAYLQGPPITNVCVLPTDLIETSAAYTVGSGKILILYNLYLYKDMEELASTVAHEYHHSAWTSSYYDQSKPLTLLDYLVFEGKAVAFQSMLYPGVTSLPVYGEEQAGNRKIIEQNLHSTNYPFMQRIMFGGDELPLAFGYSEGYRMVQAFINSHPSLSVEQWTAATPAEIYQLPK